MPNRRSRAVLTLICVCVAAAWGAASQEKPAAQPSPEEMAKMIAKWQAVANPGEHHKVLERFVGKWDLTLKIWQGGPGSQPIETKGTSESKLIFGGRYIQDEVKSEMMMPGADGKMTAVKFEGTGLTGYDNFRKVYVGTWADSMGTQLLVMRGAFDPAKKTLTMYGEMDEPSMDLIGRTVKYVTRIVDDRTHVFEIHNLDTADGYKVMEITYRKK